MNPETNGQLIVPLDHGVLTVDVWPTYMGIGLSTDGVTLVEMIGHCDYERGQIWWRHTDDGDILGHARVLLPKGTYTHLIFCHGPTEHVVALEKFEHPVTFAQAGCFDIDPIVNRDYIPRR